MGEELLKSLWRFCIYAVIFVGLVWLLLGIPPAETYTRVKTNITRIFSYVGMFAHDMNKTAGDMKKAGDVQLNEANARFHGHDLGLDKVDNMLREDISKH